MRFTALHLSNFFERIIVMHPNQFNLPLVAILRGLDPFKAAAVGRILFDVGFRLLEVPLNRPGALECISILSKAMPEDGIVGGGTMLSMEDVDDVNSAGGRLFVAPNCNRAVIAHARSLGMLCAPGVATPTEAFLALEAGAHALKIFPSDSVGHGGLKAMRTVLPTGTPLWPVGGVEPAHIQAWMAAGATGFGLGSTLYTPDISLQLLAQRAQNFVEALCSSANS